MIHHTSASLTTLLPLLTCLLPGTASAASSTAQEQGQAKPVAAKSVAGLLKRMEAAEARFDRVAAEIEMRQIVDMTGRFEGGKKIEMKARVRFSLLRKKSGDGEAQVFAKMRTESQGPGGLTKIAVVRNQEGAFIHEANEMSGQQWLHVPKELLARLTKAERVLGESGAGRFTGTSKLGSFLGAPLLEGLSGAYELSLARPIKIGDATCEHVVGKLKSEGGDASMLGRGRPDRVDLYVDQKTLLLRRMVHSLSGEELYKVELTSLDLAPALNESDFVMQPTGGAKFEDITKDPFAEASIRSQLERLSEWEKQQSEPAKEEGDKGKQPEGDGKKER